MAHLHNFCISSQMKFKLGRDIIWVRFTSKSWKKVDDVIVIIVSMTSLLFSFL